MQFDSTPFERIRARALAGYAILAFIATILTILILESIFPELEDESSPLHDALMGLLLYTFFFLFTFSMLSSRNLSYNRLFGAFPEWRTLGGYSLWAIPLAILSVSSFFLLQDPLSSVMPEPIREHLTNGSTTIIHTGGDKHVLANLLNFLTIVLVAPVVEEFIVRGILLTRWAAKWGTVRSVIASSVIFALLHNNIIGMFCIACVLSIFYIRTKSLFIPIIIHITNNSIAWILAWIGTEFGESASDTTEVEFNELWQVGLIGVVITIPCAIYFWRRYISNIDWQVPYLSEPPNSEVNENSCTYP